MIAPVSYIYIYIYIYIIIKIKRYNRFLSVLSLQCELVLNTYWILAHLKIDNVKLWVMSFIQVFIILFYTWYIYYD